MSYPQTKIVVTKEKENKMSSFKLYLYTIDGEAVTSLIDIDDEAEFLLAHPEAVVTNRR